MMPDVLELVIGSSFTPDARLDLVICDATRIGSSLGGNTSVGSLDRDERYRKRKVTWTKTSTIQMIC
jgi:hypothetical protein